MKYELVRRKERITEGALDTLGSGTVVPGGQKEALAPPSTRMIDLKREIFREFRRRDFF